MSKLSKLFLTAGLTVAGIFGASAASAEVKQIATHGAYVVVADNASNVCGMAAKFDEKSAIIFAYDPSKPTMLITYTHTNLAGMVEGHVPVTFAIDEQSYNWDGATMDGAVLIPSDDSRLPVALVNAEFFGAAVEGTPLFIIQSDADFEAAMKAVIACGNGPRIAL